MKADWFPWLPWRFNRGRGCWERERKCRGRGVCRGGRKQKKVQKRKCKLPGEKKGGRSEGVGHVGGVDGWLMVG